MKRCEVNAIDGTTGIKHRVSLPRVPIRVGPFVTWGPATCLGRVWLAARSGRVILELHAMDYTHLYYRVADRIDCESLLRLAKEEGHRELARACSQMANADPWTALQLAVVALPVSVWQSDDNQRRVRRMEKMLKENADLYGQPKGGCNALA